MATKLYDIETGSVGIGPFESWAEAWAFKSEHQVPGRVINYDDPATEVENFAGNPEPQEMTARWARRFARAA